MVAPNPTNPTTNPADPLIPIRQVPARVPWFPEVSRFTLVRWIQKGTARSGDGKRVHCRGLKAGQTWYVRASWLRAFLDELESPAAPKAVRPDAARAQADAEAILAADGIG